MNIAGNQIIQLIKAAHTANTPLILIGPSKYCQDLIDKAAGELKVEHIDCEIYEKLPKNINEHRGMVINVYIDLLGWRRWAKEQQIHSKIINFISNNLDLINEGKTSLNCWIYLSDFLYEAENNKLNETLKAAGIQGLIGDLYGIEFINYYLKIKQNIEPIDIVQNYYTFRPTLLNWKFEGKHKLIKKLLNKFKNQYSDIANWKRATIDNNSKNNIRSFINDLPADFKRDALNWLYAKNYKL